MIYLDNAATTLRKPPQVIDAVARAMGSFGNSARGTHEGALTASRTTRAASLRRSSAARGPTMWSSPPTRPRR